jgi:3-oxoacyl-[acyl-carrier protein] reductase
MTAKKDLKKALIIGGEGGIGSAMADLMLKNNYLVCSTYHTKSGQNGRAPRQKKPDLYNYHIDVADDLSVKKTLKKIYSEHGRIDVMIFAPTAKINPRPLPNKSWDDFSRHIGVQIKGMYSVVKNSFEQIKQGQKIKFIVILTEGCIGTPPVYLSDYISAKYGLMGLVKCLAVELAKYNCTFNMISPGMTNTELISAFPSKMIDLTAQKNPLKRIAEPKDIAKVALFLASEGSDYLNGANILVNGGNVMS